MKSGGSIADSSSSTPDCPTPRGHGAHCLLTAVQSEVSDDGIAVLASKAKTKKSREPRILPEFKEVLDRHRKAPDGNDLLTDAYVFGDDTGRLMSRERFVRTLARR